MITVLQRVGPPNDNLTTKKGKNVFQRGSQYVDDVEKKRGNKPLWKHVQVKHGGVMSVPIFSHFKMEAKAWPALVFFFGGLARRSFSLGKEGSEDDGGEGKLGGEGGEKRKFLTFSPPFCER